MARTKIVSRKDANKLRKLYYKHFSTEKKSKIENTRLTDHKLRKLAKKESININCAKLDGDNYNQELQAFIINKLKERPVVSIPARTCFDCGKPGHFAKMAGCELRKNDTCDNCHEKGHWECGCPELLCKRCQSNSHKEDICVAAKDIFNNDLTNTLCHKCGELGHAPGNCDAIMEELINLPATDI